MNSEDIEAETASMGEALSSTFRGRNTAKTADDLKKARETRASEALSMKDEQLRILSDQNGKLLQSLDKVRYWFATYVVFFKFIIN